MTEEEWTMEETEQAIKNWYMFDTSSPDIWSRDTVQSFFMYGRVDSILIDLSQKERDENRIGINSQSIAMGQGWTE